MVDNGSSSAFYSSQAYANVGWEIDVWGRLRAQQADEVVRFRITNPGQALYKVAVPKGIGDGTSAQLLQEVVSNDLALSGFFKVLDPTSFVADLAKEGLDVAIDSWRPVGAEAVIKAHPQLVGGDLTIEFRLYELVKGDKPVLTKSYRASAQEPRKLAHLFAGEVVRYFTGEDTFFGSQIAFARGSGAHQEVAVVGQRAGDRFGSDGIDRSSTHGSYLGVRGMKIVCAF